MTPRGRLHRLEDEVARLEREERRHVDERDRLADRLSSLYNTLPAAVLTLDGDGRIQDCNPAASGLFGEPLAGELWRDIITRAFNPDAASGQDLVLRDGRIVSLATCPLATEPGQILLFQDITETRRLQEGMAHQRRLAEMGRMAASLAHQIRTPLASALLYASQLERGDLPEEKRARFSSRVVGSLRHLEGLIKNMLLFARGGVAGEEALTTEAILSEAEFASVTQISEMGATLRVENRAPGLGLRGNRALLVSAIGNLISNALEASGPGARIELTARPARPDGIDFLVRDNGPGIPPEIRPHLFEPFRTTRSGGTGLGLAVVSAVARAHRGEVWVESEPGQGSTFALRLPAGGAGEGAPAQVPQEAMEWGKVV